MLAGTDSHDAFLRLVQLDEMPIQTAMLLLRMCLVPAYNYYLRCIAPACIEDGARQFDEQIMAAAMSKLGLDEGERNERTTTLLQRKLRDGGWGLTSAARTSPAAFLGSLAACHTEPVFAQYCGHVPVPHTSQLRGWIDDSLQRVRCAAPGDEYQADVEPLLAAKASAFFSFHSSAHPPVTTKLQHALNAKANEHNVAAAVQRMKEQSRRGDRWEWAHHKTVWILRMVRWTADAGGKSGVARDSVCECRG